MTMHFKTVWPALVAIACLTSPVVRSDEALSDSYILETVEFPEGVPPEVGALQFGPDGDLYVALRRGDILVARPTEDPKAFAWRRFATGLHNPCGMAVLAKGHIVVSQMAELTEIKDSDGDGVADVYNNLSTDWGLSGNYHETIALCPDGKNGYYLAIGTASHAGPTFSTPRGPYSENGRRGRNYSSVQWKGWTMHYQDGKLTPYASGFRMPNGICLGPDGTLWAGDNQGDWKGPSPLYQVLPDTFAGHPASLVWDSRFDALGHPLVYPRRLLDDLYNKPAVQLPHGEMMRSCGEPLFLPADSKFGPFPGDVLIPDETGRRIARCMVEKVDGYWQGACTWLLRNNDLRQGNNRFCLSPDGATLYVGQTSRGWGPISEGVQRLRYTGKVPFDILSMHLRTDGFELKFSKSVAVEAVSAALAARSLRWEYGYHYGSAEFDVRQEKVETVEAVAGKSDTVFIKIGGLAAGRVYELKFANLAADGQKLENNMVHYSVNRLQRPASPHHVTVNQLADRFRVEVDGELFTEYRTEGFSKPVLWPILGPDGVRMTRDWPIKTDTPGEAQDHPHHKGLFIGHQGINGTDFWHEDEKSGKVVQSRVIETRGGEDRAMIKTFNKWLGIDGQLICVDTRTMEFSVTDNARIIDLELNMHAVKDDLKFEAFKDGFVGLRTHPALRLQPAKGSAYPPANAINSEGVAGIPIWSKHASWVDYWGNVEGHDVGIAAMIHPDNPRSPGWWHAREYGLIAINPFAPKDISGDGELVVPRGQTVSLRYRFVFHKGNNETADIATMFKAYTTVPGQPVSVMPAHPGFPEEYLKPGAVQEDEPAKKKDDKPVKKKEDKPAAAKDGQRAVIKPPVGVPVDTIKGLVRGAARSAGGSVKVIGGGLIEGGAIYSDREFVFAKVPDAIRGAELVQTRNDDKKPGTVSYTVDFAEAATIVLLVDTRVEGAMDWLKGGNGAPTLKKTGMTVETDSDWSFRVYTADVEPGKVVLPAQSGGSFYTVAATRRAKN